MHFFFACAVALGFPKGPIQVSVGMGTGSDFREMDEANRSSYAMGFANGIDMAPRFGAPQAEMEWFRSVIQPGMSNVQLAAMISTYIQEHPERWHEPLNMLGYDAFLNIYFKNHPKQKGNTKELSGNAAGK